MFYYVYNADNIIFKQMYSVKRSHFSLGNDFHY